MNQVELRASPDPLRQRVQHLVEQIEFVDSPRFSRSRGTAQHHSCETSSLSVTWTRVRTRQPLPQRGDESLVKTHVWSSLALRSTKQVEQDTTRIDEIRYASQRVAGEYDELGNRSTTGLPANRKGRRKRTGYDTVAWTLDEESLQGPPDAFSGFERSS